MSADGIGTAAIMRQTGKSKICVWRWQERFIAVDTDGLLFDKTTPSRISYLKPDVNAGRILGQWGGVKGDHFR